MPPIERYWLPFIVCYILYVFNRSYNIINNVLFSFNYYFVTIIIVFKR